MRQASESDHALHRAAAMPAFADEPLVDYLLRAVEECRAMRRPLACRYGNDQFTISPTMDAAQVVAVWHTAHCAAQNTP